MSRLVTEFASPEYVNMLPEYVQIRDCYNGSRAIKEAREAYLPRLKNQVDEDYLNYLSRALFFPITGKTCSTLVGLALTSAPTIAAPSEMMPMFEDTRPGYQYSELVQQTMSEVVLMGRFGMLIDAPILGGPIRIVPYIAENIVRWITDDFGAPIDVMLREYVEVTDPQDEFKITQTLRYRRLRIMSGIYVSTTYDSDLKEVSSVSPTFFGNTIGFIPFVVCGSSGVHMWVDKPPMQDISTINVSHYMSSADLEWGRHITGLPTPVVSGMDSSTKLYIGGTAAWILPDANAKAYYMEFLGQGLQSLEKAMSEKLGLMASMSARLIDISSRGSEAAETVRLRYASDSASLVQIISSVEAGLNAAYNMIAKISNYSEVRITLSRDVLSSTMSFGDLKTLYEAYFKGGLSKQALLYNLRRVGAVDPNRSDADELAAIVDPPKEAPAANNQQ